MRKKALDGMTPYAKDIVFGGVVAGRMVRPTCARNVMDLKESVFHRLHFEVEVVQRLRLNRVSCPSVDFFPQTGLALPSSDLFNAAVALPNFRLDSLWR